MIRKEISYEGHSYRRMHRTKIRKGIKFPFTLYYTPSQIDPNSTWGALIEDKIESLEDFERLDNELNYYLGGVYYYERLYEDNEERGRTHKWQRYSSNYCGYSRGLGRN